MGGAVPTGEYITAADRKENGTVDQYSFPEQRLKKVQEPERILEDTSQKHANGYLENTQDAAQEVTPSLVEEAVEEPQKHTYASIVCTNLSWNLLLFLVHLNTALLII